MYSASGSAAGAGQQALGEAGEPLDEQEGAYYEQQAPQTDVMYQSYAIHAIHAHHKHHAGATRHQLVQPANQVQLSGANLLHHASYPISSDSSLGSSNAFSSSAQRVGAFFRQCCSKNCLLIFCLLLILLIFIFVIGLSAYLNFLINLNKTDLTPLSGRLRVDQQADSFSEALLNRTSREFLAKQQQYETILRGAFDRTQSTLKSYPNHLVKCEVYAFKPGSLWVHFRLFINKRTMLHDTQLMKRKAKDEQLERDFLPRLTQQTLHSGFEQLVGSWLSREPTNGRRAAEIRQPRATLLDSSAASSRARSFDDQINRLMPLIEAIDLQSIQVTSEFDMLQSLPPSTAMSDNLRATPFFTTSSSVLVATAGTSSPRPNGPDYELATSAPTLQDQPQTPPVKLVQQGPERTQANAGQQQADEVSVSTKKFTLYGYKENATRPATSQRPTLAQSDSPFLTNHQHKKAAPAANVTQQSSIARPPAINKSIAEPKVIRLIAGQQAPVPPPLRSTEKDTRSGNRTASLSAPPTTSEKEGGPQAKDAAAQARAEKAANETSVIVAPMVAPYQKIEFSSTPASTNHQVESGARRWQAYSAQSPAATEARNKSIEELFAKALSEGARRSNLTSIIKLNEKAGETQTETSTAAAAPRRLITVTPLGRAHNNSLANLDEWQKALGSTMRTQANNAQPRATTTPPAPTTPGAVIAMTTLATPKPKVSPPMKQGGSLLVSTRQQQQQQQAQEPSAVVLSRDLAPPAVNKSAIANNEGQLATTGAASNNTQPSATANSGRTSSAQSRTDKQPQRKPPARNNTTQANDQHKQRQPKPTIKHKTKKVGVEQLAGNDTALINNNRPSSSLAKAESAKSQLVNHHQLQQPAQKLAANNSQARQNKNGRNKTNEPFNYNADHLMPTLPTTIELTRSTSASAAPTVAPSSPAPPGATSGELAEQRVAALSPPPADYTTTTLASAARPLTDTESPLSSRPPVNGAFLPADRGVAPQTNLLASSLNRPGTTNFSNQWRPLASSGRNSTQSSSELSNERDFALADAGQRRPASSFSLIVSSERLPASLSAPGSEQGSQSPFAMSGALLESPLKPGSASRTSSGSLPRVRLTNKLANTYQLINGAARSNGANSNEFESHRMSRMRQAQAADQLGSAHSSTHSSTSSFASSTSSSLMLDANTRIVDDFMITDKIDDNTRGATLLPPLVVSGLEEGVSAANRLRALAAHPKRTRGPFAFETLKAANEATEDSLSGTAQRPERAAEQRLLLRKRLFLANGGLDELASAPSTTSTSLLEEPPLDLEATLPNNTALAEQADVQLDRFGNRQAQLAQQTIRCTYYGCKARHTLKFTCLNHTQICDDFIDCHDESDELDCVSLLKHDAISNKLSFSNGAGIIYLNRKGSLAPMCIDYFREPESNELNAARKQQELVRQINTIGQYACSLQSFSRLVSVKINHHHLVDSLDLIKSSRLYHRLSIIGQDERRDKSQVEPTASFRSGSPEHEVEVSTSEHCPSQRTVFVKCGGFECGQDSFSLIDQANLASRKGGVIINDFPWLVKLYWKGALACHGYLIDELWLICSSECFGQSQEPTAAEGWSAEISYEHYGNHDYQSIESNRRAISQVLFQPAQPSEEGQDERAFSRARSAIVLAKLEKPVRFSPLNRPICLPLSANNNKSLETEAVYKDCVTAALPPTNLQQGSSPPASPTQDLVLSKVKVEKPEDCLKDEEVEGGGNVEYERRRRQAQLDDLICVTELATPTTMMPTTTAEPKNNLMEGNEGTVSPTGISKQGIREKASDSTRILICSTSQTASRSRSKWTVVGVQNKVESIPLGSNKRLFTAVLSQINWIVDTMNPRSHDSTNLSDQSAAFATQQNQTTSICNQFKCFSGECLSWSRICDGLYDCSSHEDEKDCHK